MNIGTKITGQLIVDNRFVKNMSLDTAISAKKDSLICALSGTGIEIYQLHDKRNVNFNDGTIQIRQTFDLVLSKKLSKNDIYKVINSVCAQPLEITNNYYN